MAVEIPKPRFRGRLHEVAFFVSVPAGAALFAVARGWTARLSALVFAVSLTGLFAVSAAYHVGRWTERARLRMKRLDHSMIFVLIAGTYTPFCLLVVGGAWGGALLALVWTGALAGVVLKLVNPERRKALTAAMYVALGWLAIFAAPRVVRTLGVPELALLVTGGLLYTLGAIVLLRRQPDPSPRVFGYHEIWHAMGIAAGLCHYAAILLVVLSAT